MIQLHGSWQGNHGNFMLSQLEGPILHFVSDRLAFVGLAPEREHRVRQLLLLLPPLTPQKPFWSWCMERGTESASCLLSQNLIFLQLRQNAKVLRESAQVFFSSPPHLFFSPTSLKGLRRLVITDLIDL